MPMNGIDRCVWLSIRPGSDEAAADVDDVRARGRVDAPDRRDPLAGDQHVRVVLAVGRDDAAALQDGGGLVGHPVILHPSGRAGKRRDR